jgi:hypothetical protein
MMNVTARSCPATIAGLSNSTVAITRPPTVIPNDPRQAHDVAEAPAQDYLKFTFAPLSRQENQTLLFFDSIIPSRYQIENQRGQDSMTFPLANCCKRLRS